VVLFCLKAPHRRRECPKQTEASLTILPKILVELMSASRVSLLPPDMANLTKVVDFVIQFTVTGAVTGAVSRNEKAPKSYQQYR
jgi:hypothetical protein